VGGRVELAAGHRVLAHYGRQRPDYIISAAGAGEPDHMLIKRTDWMFAR